MKQVLNSKWNNIFQMRKLRLIFYSTYIEETLYQYFFPHVYVYAVAIACMLSTLIGRQKFLVDISESQFCLWSLGGGVSGKISTTYSDERVSRSSRREEILSKKADRIKKKNFLLLLLLFFRGWVGWNRHLLSVTKSNKQIYTDIG